MYSSSMDKRPMGSNTERRLLHVAMLPWSAFGHMIPYSNLAVSLVRSGSVRVSFLSTPGNLCRIPTPPPDAPPHLLSFVPLPFADVTDSAGSPLHGEATTDLDFDEIQYLKVAYDLLREPLAGFLADSSPDLLIADFCAPWAVDLLRELGIPMMMFSVYNVPATILMNTDYLAGKRPWETLTKPPPGWKFPPSVAYRIDEAMGIHCGIHGKNASGYTDAERIATVITSADAMIVRSCYEFDEIYLKTMEEVLGKTVIPAGFLPRDKSAPSRDADDRNGILNWLDDGKKESSVVFVAFGSELPITKDHIHEIALGIELSGIPFLWALRRPIWARDVDPEDEAKLAEAILPSGFIPRTRSRGKVCFGWVPQVEILSHPSVGGTLTHSGWGTAIEILQHGLPLVTLPYMFDQPIVSRDMVHRNLGLEVARDKDGEFTRKGLADALRFALISDGGVELRANCREMAKLFGDLELQQGYVNKLVNHLKEKLVPSNDSD